MYPANITRAESQERGLLVQTHQYQVLLDLSGRRIGGIDPERQFLSTTAIRFEQLAPARTFVNLIADEVISANIDGTNLDSRDFHDDKVFFEVGPGTHDLVVSAVCRYSRTGEGLHRFTDPVDGEPYLYSQFEPADARRVFACFEQPDLKARWQFSVIVPEGWTVISNSPQVWPQRVEDGVNRFDSPFTEPISSYLAAIVAGRYHIEKDVYHGIVDVPLTLACRQSMRPYLDSERLFEITKRGFAVFEEAFGRRYPFKDYAQVFVPEYNFGAMENAGCVTYRDEYLFRYRVPHHTLEDRDNTVLHEMAHMWFGDLVTMKWWDDLWLNESFAEWASHFNQQRIREKVLAGQWEPLGPVPDDPWATFANNRKNWAYRQDQLPTTHPIAADMVDLEAIEQNFDGITYAKGASTLKQLVAFVGLDAFLAGVRGYFGKHAWGNTELADLLAELSQASGRDLSRFTAEWLQTPGVNTLSAEFEVGADGRYTSFAIRQSAPAEHPTLRQHRVAVGCYQRGDDGKLTRVKRVELDVDGPLTPVPELVGEPQPDLALVNDDDLTYAKIRLDSRSFATAVAGLRRIDSTLARALVWGAAWDMCRDAELPAADFVELVLANIADEVDTTAVSTELNQALTAIDYYSADRAGLRARFAEGVYQLLMKAAPGSDHQLSFARAFITADSSPEGALMLQRWLFDSSLEGLVFYSETPSYKRVQPELRDGVTPAGLAVDTDLRWRIVTALARRGVFGEAEIEAELQIDPTAAGAERAAAARAAQPTAAAKAAAWERLTAEADIPNETHGQIAAQFFQFGQEGVLAEYLPKYRQVVEEISDAAGEWATRSNTLRQHIAISLFPKQLLDESELAVFEDWFHGRQWSAFTTRTMLERLDDAERAVRAQKAERG